MNEQPRSATVTVTPDDVAEAARAGRLTEVEMLVCASYFLPRPGRQPVALFKWLGDRGILARSPQDIARYRRHIREVFGASVQWADCNGHFAETRMWRTLNDVRREWRAKAREEVPE